MLVAMAGLSLPLSAQFYSNGASPRARWRTLHTERVTVVAPDYAEEPARKVLFLVDSLTDHIGYGLGHTPLRMPIVMHSSSSASNGISIMAPRRIEMCTTPATASYATDWLGQLSVHEYRHAAQYGALFSGMAKYLYWLLGEQALLATSGVMPFWWLEGDAVDAETQASLYGRALQPSYTAYYRAVGRDILRSKNPDKWFGGSYNHYTPSHYELGYQMVTTANTLAGRYVWGEVMEYAAKWPITITPYEWAMRKRLGYSTEELFRTTFERLNNHWDSLPARESNTTPVPTTRRSPYESYRYPMWAPTGEILALRSTFDTPEEFVFINPESGRERRLRRVGYINTPPAIVGNHLYWSEITQLSSYAQEMGMVLYRTPLDGHGERERVTPRTTRALYPTEWQGELAYVRYNLEGTYTIVTPEEEHPLPFGVECHGMTSLADGLYLLVTTREGMSIERLDPATGGRTVVKPTTQATLSALRGGTDEKLYFGSIATGYEEIHSLDPTTGHEQRLTTTPYGAHWGAPNQEGDMVVLSTFDTEGYHLATAPTEGVESVEQTPLPRNIVNPERYRWEGFPTVNNIDYGPEEKSHSHATIPTKRYHHLKDLINFHSWAPIYYRPEQIASGNLGDVSLGVTLSSQSLLSDAVTTLGGYLRPTGVVGARLNVKYIGWWPKLEVSADVNNGLPQIAAPKGSMMAGGNFFTNYDHSESVTTPSLPRSNYSFYGRLYLPIVLSHSNLTRVLTPSVELSHNNNLLYSPTTERYTTGQNIAAATLQWSCSTRQAYRNLQPRWGLALVGGIASTLEPFNTPYTVGVYGRAYTPAFGANDGFTLCASWQGIEGSGPLGYAPQFNWLIPRGARTSVYPDNLTGLSVQYDTPLCYPDWGWSGVVLVKRLRLGAFVDSLWGNISNGTKSVGSNITTFGCDLRIDTSWLRLPEQGDLTLRVGCYFDVRDLAHPTPSFGIGTNF